jgi:hypothetical protein
MVHLQDSSPQKDSSKESMQLRHSLAPRVAAGTTAARTSVVQRGFLQQVLEKIRCAQSIENRVLASCKSFDSGRWFSQ